MSKKLKYDDVCDILAKKGFRLLDNKYINNSQKLNIVDNYGYKYITTVADFSSGKNPRKFYVSNPHTIDNIKLYLKINNIKLLLISNKYISSGDKLIFEDFEGYRVVINMENLQMGSFPNRFHKGNPYSIYNLKLLLEKLNLNMEVVSSLYKNEKSDIYLIDSEGYKYNTNISNLLAGHLPLKIHKANKCTIYNINLYLKINKINIKLLSEKYESASEKLKWKCSCGKTFKRSWTSVYSQKSYRCLACSKITSINELNAIKILDLYKIRYKQQYVLEDCKSWNDACLKYDIVILNSMNKVVSVIEVDGEQHMRPIEYFGGEIKFANDVYNDATKNSYCEDNNISILRIHFYELAYLERIIKEYIENILKINKDIIVEKNNYFKYKEFYYDNEIIDVLNLKYIDNLLQTEISRITSFGKHKINNIINLKGKYSIYESYVQNLLTHSHEVNNTHPERLNKENSLKNEYAIV